jgi:hypothetical protein
MDPYVQSGCEPGTRQRSSTGSYRPVAPSRHTSGTSPAAELRYRNVHPSSRLAWGVTGAAGLVCPTTTSSPAPGPQSGDAATGSSTPKMTAAQPTAGARDRVRVEAGRPGVVVRGRRLCRTRLAASYSSPSPWTLTATPSTQTRKLSTGLTQPVRRRRPTAEWRGQRLATP